MTFDVQRVKELCEATWIENECPVCRRTLMLRDGQEPIGPCDACVRLMLDEALEALATTQDNLAIVMKSADYRLKRMREIGDERDTAIDEITGLRGRIVAAMKALDGDS